MWTQSLIGAFLVAQMVKISRVRKIPWRRDRLPTPVFLGFPGGSDVKAQDSRLQVAWLIKRAEETFCFTQTHFLHKELGGWG